MSTTTILITRTVKFRGGRSIDRGVILPARKTPVELGSPQGYQVAHPNGMEGCYAHVPMTHAVEVR